jgi:hypothetical protein
MMEFGDYVGNVVVGINSACFSKTSLRRMAEEVEIMAQKEFPNSAVCVVKTEKIKGVNCVEFTVEVSQK